jgi:uncharacterized membrane protein (DUF106 family)
MIKKIFSNTFYVKSLIFILSILVFLFLISIQNNLASQEQMKNDPINESTEDKENSSNKITQAQNENNRNEVTKVESDDSDLDNQTYGEDDDDFIPTEEVPADESIPFPTNI